MTPSFVLSGPSGTLLAEGIDAGFSEIAAAQHALMTGAAPVIVGALPFDLNGPAALHRPRSVRHTTGLPDWPDTPPPVIHTHDTLPPGPVHRERIAEAVSRLRAADCALQKVVLA
ncbi:MAG: isochorismate synthase, partial [Mycobacterium sp.]